MTRFVGSRVAAFMIRPILSTFLTGFAEDVFKSTVERLQTRPGRLSVIFQYNSPAPLEIGPALRCLTLCLSLYFVSGLAAIHFHALVTPNPISRKAHPSPNSEIIPGPSTTATMLLSRKYAQRLSY